MNPSLQIHGFSLHSAVIPKKELPLYRDEADRVTTLSKSASIRNLRRKSSLFHKLALSELLQNLLPPGLAPVRSILFNKTAEENWAVPWHQDITIAVTTRIEIPGYGPWSCKDDLLHVQPPAPLLENMVTIRIHLDETPKTNGALNLIPGSHRWDKIAPALIPGLSKTRVVACECLAGDALLMKPLILHSSHRSESPKNRRIIHFEYARLSDLHPSLDWAE